MSKTKGPESKIRSSVGDSPQAILNSVNGRVDERLTKVKLQTKKEGKDVNEKEVGMSMKQE